jgi:methyl-accepting chemotaxis protein
VLSNLSIRNAVKVFALIASLVYVALGVAAYLALEGSADLQMRIVAAVLVGLAVLALGNWWVQALSAHRLDKLVIATEILSTGDCDLTRRLPTMSGSFGKVCAALNGFVVQLHGVVSNVAGNAGEIARTAARLSESNAHLSQRAAQQSSTLKEAASSMEEFTQSVKHNAQSARLASELASTASATATKGGEVVSRAVAMINAANEGSRKIGTIVATIDAVAFQTNILALNAAVEAARAGEQGRGFAVVAAEVRALARRCAAAAKEVNALVGTAIEQVDEGAKLADKAGSSMVDIVAAIQKASEIMAAIDVATSDQANGIERVNRAIAQMTDVTRENAALVAEGAAAADAMRQQAEELTVGVARFKLNEQKSPGTSLQRVR